MCANFERLYRFFLFLPLVDFVVDFRVQIDSVDLRLTFFGRYEDWDCTITQRTELLKTDTRMPPVITRL